MPSLGVVYGVVEEYVGVYARARTYNTAKLGGRIVVYI